MFATNPFKPATREQLKLRLALTGPAGSGKTWTALAIARELGQKIAVIDTERGSARKYAGEFQFDVFELTHFHPQRYIEAIKAAAQFGYDVVVIDSLSHEWNGAGGVLELVDNATKASKSGNSFTAWGGVTPLHNQLIDALTGTNIHIIATMRSKTDYAMETNEKGKQTPRKIGLAPIQRDGMEFEFDIVGEMDMENNLVVTKTRCSVINGQIFQKPGKEFADIVKGWLGQGEPPQLRIVEDEQAPSERTEAGQQMDTPVDAYANLRSQLESAGITDITTIKPVEGTAFVRIVTKTNYDAVLDGMLKAVSLTAMKSGARWFEVETNAKREA